jgi:RecB family exonuclease
MWLERLKAFTQSEIKHFGDDFRVHGCEMEFKTSHCGMNLVGKIDRVDVRDGKYYVIDYKSGKIPKTTKNALPYESDFQLQFYYLLVSTLGEVRDAYYYDLKNASLVEDALFDEKLLLLDERLNELKDKNQNFTMSEDINKCKYCPYIKLCDRSS